MQPSSVRTSLLSLSIALSLSACGGGGGGGGSAVNNNPAPETINGAISAPGGTVAWQAPQSFPERLMDWAMPAAYADISGVAAVPDGTVVELIRIDNTGSTVATLASGTTNNGRYSLEFDGSPSSDLVVQVRNTATNEVLRAFLTASTTDISVESDGAVTLILNDIATDRANRPLANYTIDEISDLTAGLRTLTSATSTEVGINISTTRAALIASAAGNTSISNFIGTLNTDGRTAQKLGSSANFFSTMPGFIRLLIGTQTSSTNNGTQTVTNYFNNVRFNGTQVVGGIETSRIESSNALNRGANDTFLLINDSGVQDFTDQQAGITDRPITLASFPLKPGTSEQALTNTPLSVRDFDQDGMPDSIITNTTVTNLGFINTSLFSFTLKNVLAIQISATLNGSLSSGSNFSGTITEIRYFLADQGIIKNEYTEILTIGDNTTQNVFIENASPTSIPTHFFDGRAPNV